MEDKDYGTLTVGYGSSKEREVKIIDFIRATFKVFCECFSK